VTDRKGTALRGSAFRTRSHRRKRRHRRAVYNLRLCDVGFTTGGLGAIESDLGVRARQRRRSFQHEPIVVSSHNDFRSARADGTSRRCTAPFISPRERDGSEACFQRDRTTMQLDSPSTFPPRPSPKEAIPYSSAALRQDLDRLRGIWDDCQASRDRNAIYAYLTAVYGLVAWWAAEGQEIGRARRALRLQRLELSDREDPFAAIIRCTADPAKADKRTRSKWSRALRFAAAYKPESEPLGRFIRRKRPAPVEERADSLLAALFGQTGQAQSRGVIAPDAFINEYQAGAQLCQSYRLDLQRFPQGRHALIQLSLLGEARGEHPQSMSATRVLVQYFLCH
jgi:hypothetical protein